MPSGEESNGTSEKMQSVKKICRSDRCDSPVLRRKETKCPNMLENPKLTCIFIQSSKESSDGTSDRLQSVEKICTSDLYDPPVLRRKGNLR